MNNYKNFQQEMKTILLFPLFCNIILGQTETLISSVIYAAISGQTEYYRMKDRELFGQGDKKYLEYSKKWHNLQFAEVGSAFVVGGSIALTSDNVYDAVKQSFVAGAIRWIIRDGIYNLNNKNDFFYQSPKTTSFLEPLATWYVKIGLLAIIIIWNYLEI